MLTQTSRRPRLFSAHGLCVCKHFAGWFAGGRMWSNEMAVVSLMVLASVSATANASLVAHWTFDENSGTTAHDSSGNGYHATAIEQTPVWDSNGKYGGCLNLNGTYGMSIPAEAFANVSEAVSVSMWVNYHPNQPDNTTVLFQAGADVNQEHSFVISVRTEWKTDAVDFETGRDEDDNETWRNAKLRDRAGRWDHYIFVSDTTNSFQAIYHNGVRVTDGTTSHQMSGITKAHIGLATDRVHDQQRARIDDVRIYNHGLTAEEARDLHRFGPALFKLGAAVRQGQDILEKKGPQQAIPFIEGKVAEVERWGRQHPTEKTSSFNELLFDLNFLLAKASQDAHLPKSDVEAAYQRASQQGAPSLWRCGSVLHWLQKNGKTAEYERIACSLNHEDLDDLMTEASEKAELMIDGQKQHEAIDLLETNLAIYTTWKNEPSGDHNTFAPAALPDAYLYLATAKRAVGAPKKDIAAAYGKAFGPSEIDFEELGFEQERAAALIWLVNNRFTDDFTRAVKLFSQAQQITGNLKRIVEPVCKDLESRRNWAAFERFLDTLFSEAEHRGEWAIFVEFCLDDETNRWAKRYFKYVDSKPRLKLSRDCVTAEKYVENKDFKRAAELYEDIMKLCGPEDDRAVFEWELCKCLFHGGGDGQAVAKLEGFIADYKQTHRNLVKEAMLLKSSAHVQLDEPDKALESFSTLAKEYPETKNMPEVNFYVSYSYMLQGKSEAAEEAFERVIRDYPGSLYASKASMCLTRIKGMAEHEGTESD